MHRLLIWLLNPAAMAGLSLAPTPAASQDEGEAPVSAFDDSYALSAATQSGFPITWRADRRNGRVSLCFLPRRGPENVICSDWSGKAPRSARSNYSINAEASALAGVAWVWRINTVTGLVSYCSVPCCKTDIAKERPKCAEIAGEPD
ncbi:MAG: hypothetical protein QNJ94_12605 [Alphaproteobacteria bacterium]|nr:hypothetical protein [Alphaproteobacteria bacterium]